jgi:hypothetical protein
MLCLERMARLSSPVLGWVSPGFPLDFLSPGFPRESQSPDATCILYLRTHIVSALPFGAAKPRDGLP